MAKVQIMEQKLAATPTLKIGKNLSMCKKVYYQFFGYAQLKFFQ